MINTHELSVDHGRVPEWLKGTGCKPVDSVYLGSNPSAPTSFARVAQTVEHFVGNEEVTGSSPVAGSILAYIHDGADSIRKSQAIFAVVIIWRCSSVG